MKSRILLLAALATTAVSAQAMLPTTGQVNTNQAVQAVQAVQAQQAQATENQHQQIDRKLNAFVVRTDAQGAESLVPLTIADGVKQGDVVEYQGLFTNQDSHRVRKLVVTLSIPEGVELVGGVSPAAQGSADSNRFTRMPVRANIGGEIKDLPFKYYKALRWTVEDLGIGATAVVKYRVVIK